MDHQQCKTYYAALPLEARDEITANAIALRDGAHQRGRQLSEASASDAIISLYAFLSREALRQLEATPCS